MTNENIARGASPRALGASSGLTSESDLGSDPSRARGRIAAPRVASWLPMAAKVGAAVLAAVVLAIIGATAGARPPPVDGMLSGRPSADMGTAPAVAASSATVPAIAPAHPPQAPVTTPPNTESGSGVLADGRVILNVASEEELTRLPGVGPSRARAIVALRQRLAKFRAVEDLLRVKGIGRKTLRRIKPSVVLDRPPASDAGAAS